MTFGWHRRKSLRNNGKKLWVMRSFIQINLIHFVTDNSKVSCCEQIFYDVINFIKRLGTLSPGNQFRLPYRSRMGICMPGRYLSRFLRGQKISDSLANFNAKIPSIYSILEKILDIQHQWVAIPQTNGAYSICTVMFGSGYQIGMRPYSSQQTVDPQGPPNGT